MQNKYYYIIEDMLNNKKIMLNESSSNVEEDDIEEKEIKKTVKYLNTQYSNVKKYLVSKNEKLLYDIKKENSNFNTADYESYQKNFYDLLGHDKTFEDCVENIINKLIDNENFSFLKQLVFEDSDTITTSTKGYTISFYNSPGAKHVFKSGQKNKYIIKSAGIKKSLKLLISKILDDYQNYSNLSDSSDFIDRVKSHAELKDQIYNSYKANFITESGNDLYFQSFIHKVSAPENASKYKLKVIKSGNKISFTLIDEDDNPVERKTSLPSVEVADDFILLNENNEPITKNEYLYKLKPESFNNLNCTFAETKLGSSSGMPLTQNELINENNKKNISLVDKDKFISFINQKIPLFKINNNMNKEVDVPLENPFSNDDILSYIHSPYYVLSLIASKVVLLTSTISFFLLYKKNIKDYNERLEEYINNQEYFTAADNKKSKNSIKFKIGDAAERIKTFVKRIINTSNAVGVTRSDIIKHLFDTTHNSSVVHVLDGDENTAIKSNKNEIIKKLEHNCLNIFSKSDYGIGKGEILMLLLLTGVDIPATLNFDVTKNSIKESEINKLAKKLSLYSGGLDTNDIDFSKHTLPSACPTKEILKGKIFEVKEGGKESIRVGSEGIRNLNKDIIKFYQSTNAIKELLQADEKSSKSGHKLHVEILEAVSNNNKMIYTDRSNFNKIFKSFSESLNLLDQKKSNTIESSKKEIHDFIEQFYDTSLNDYISGASFNADINFGKIDDWDAGNFSEKKLLTIYTVYLAIIEALRQIIIRYTVKDIHNNDSTLSIKFKDDNHKIPTNFSLTKGNIPISDKNFTLTVENILDVLHDNNNLNDIEKLATNHNKNDSVIILQHAITLRQKLKNLNLGNIFAELIRDEISYFKIKDNFGEAEKSFESSDGLFIIQGSKSEAGINHSNLRFLFVKKGKYNDYLKISNISQHRPSYSLKVGKDEFFSKKISALEDVLDKETRLINL